MERNERVQRTKDLSKLTLCQDVQLQHGLIVHLVAHRDREAKVRKHEVQKEVYQSVRNLCQGNWRETFKYIQLASRMCYDVK